jgi:integrase
MATIKAVLRPKKNKKGEQPIYLRISHKGKTKYHSLGFSIKKKFWDKEKGKVKSNDYLDYDSINKVIRDEEKIAKDKVYSLRANREAVTSAKIKSSVKGMIDNDFIQYADKFVKRKFQANIRTGRRYQSILTKLREYTGGSFQFSELTVTWINEYSDWLAKEKKNNYGTIHSNLRGIRAILNEAIREDLHPYEKNPFLKIKMKRPKPQKTKLNVDEINELKKLDSFTSHLQQISRDAFLFSFYTCGMRFSDVCMLKWGNIEGGYLKYYVSKTKEYLSIKLLPDALNTLEKYSIEGVSIKNKDESIKIAPEVNEKLIFPLLDESDIKLNASKLISRIGSANAKVNSALKLVAKKSKISKHLSFHVARHSYANLANNSGMPLSVIQNTLNHKSSKTTEAYLNSLENEVVDNSVREFFKGIRNE